jgi:AraC-like DNA-binding protein
MHTIDLILRSMAATQLVFFALLLFRRGGQLPALRVAALLPVGLAAFAVTSTRGVQLGPLELPLTLLCVANPVWFWIFTEAIFDDDFRVEPRHLGVLASVWIVGAWHELAMPAPPQGPVHWLYTAMVLALLIVPLGRLLRQHSGDLVEARRRWRVWFVVAVASYGLGGLVLLAVFGGPLPATWARLHIALLFVASAAASLALVPSSAASGSAAPPASSSPGVAEPVQAPSPRTGLRPTPAADEALVRRIVEAMEAEHLYRTEDLTVARLARAVGSQEYLVRRAINGSLGYRNFSDFLHHYRLGEAAPRLLSQPHLPVLSIALDVGYGSIGPFNRAFRQRFGTTPTAYRSTPGCTPVGQVSPSRPGEDRDPSPKMA